MGNYFFFLHVKINVDSFSEPSSFYFSLHPWLRVTEPLQRAQKRPRERERVREGVEKKHLLGTK